MEGDDRSAPATVTRGIGGERGAVDDRPVRRKGVKFRPVGPAQQVTDEQTVPGQFRHHADIQPMCGIGPREKVLHEIVAAPHVGQHIVIQPFERLGGLACIVFPPDVVFDGRRAHNMLVLGRPAGVAAGRDKKGTPLAKRPFAALQGGFDQGGFDQIVVDRTKPGNALFIQPKGRVHASGSHSASSLAVSRGRFS